MIFVQEMASDDKFENWWSKRRKLAEDPDFEQWFYEDTGSIDIKLTAPKLTKLPLDIPEISVTEGTGFSAKLSIKGFESLDLGLSHFSF